MHPTIRPGEFVLLEPLHRHPRPGEVIAFRRHSKILVHRVIGIQDRGILTRGDALRSCDEPVAWNNVIGAVTALQRSGRVMALEPTLRHGVRALLLLCLYSIRNKVGAWLSPRNA